MVLKKRVRDDTDSGTDKDSGSGLPKRERLSKDNGAKDENSNFDSKLVQEATMKLANAFDGLATAASVYVGDK